MLEVCMNEGLVEVGVDEAGRGCLAGPVVAAAVIWNPDLPHSPELAMIKDSKKLSRLAREKLRAFIEDNAVACSVAFVHSDVIDKKNILQATFDAMHEAIDTLAVDADVLLVDGSCFRKYKNVRHICVIDGDNSFISIAAASILAKVHRDEYMTILHHRYPVYDWDKNVGYGTSGHLNAMKVHGISPLHRRSFRPVTESVSNND